MPTGSQIPKHYTNDAMGEAQWLKKSNSTVNGLYLDDMPIAVPRLWKQNTPPPPVASATMERMITGIAVGFSCQPCNRQHVRCRGKLPSSPSYRAAKSLGFDHFTESKVVRT